MLTIEEIAKRIAGPGGAAGRFLVGGLLAFVPIINVVSLGYLYRVMMLFKDDGSMKLPPWDRYQVLLIESMRCLILWFLFFALPIAVTLLLALLLHLVLPEFAAPAAWMIAASGFLKAPVLFTSALYIFQRTGDWKSLKQLPTLILKLRPWALQIIVPVTAFWGLLVLCLPLYGFVLFGGAIVLLIYLSQIIDAACRNASP